MSVSLWAYCPAFCDSDYCPDDCDICSRADDAMARAEEEEEKNGSGSE